jgi:hypothetical protein
MGRPLEEAEVRAIRAWCSGDIPDDGFTIEAFDATVVSICDSWLVRTRVIEAARNAPSPLYLSTAGPERGGAIYSEWWVGMRAALAAGGVMSTTDEGETPDA